MPVNGAIAFLTLLLLLIGLVSRSLHFRTNLFILVFVPLILLLVKIPFEYPVSNSSGEIAINSLFAFITIGLSGILLGTIKIDADKFIRYGYIWSWIVFFLIGAVPFTSMFTSREGGIDYMRFGYAMLPVSMFSFVILNTSTKKIVPFTLLVLSFTEMMIFGARGALLSFFIYVFISFFAITKEKKGLKVSLIAISGLLIALLPYIILGIESILKKHHIFSYALVKYSRIFETGFESSMSGRDILYKSAINRIIESPIFGSPLNSVFVDFGRGYYHNFMLEIAVGFGIPIALFLIGYLVLTSINALRHESQISKYVFFLLMTIPIGRLLVSSSIWYRPEFWFFISYSLNYRYRVLQQSWKL